jgi:hypothetical protein
MVMVVCPEMVIVIVYFSVFRFIPRPSMSLTEFPTALDVVGIDDVGVVSVVVVPVAAVDVDEVVLPPPPQADTRHSISTRRQSPAIQYLFFMFPILLYLISFHFVGNGDTS